MCPFSGVTSCGRVWRKGAQKRGLESRVQEPCESRGGRPGLSVLMSLRVSVEVKQH